MSKVSIMIANFKPPPNDITPTKSTLMNILMLLLSQDWFKVNLMFSIDNKKLVMDCKTRL